MCGENVRITLWKGGADGGLQQEIAPTVPVTAGTFSWTIPRAVAPSTRYWINISGTGMPEVFDASNGALTITASPPCTLAKPLVTVPGYAAVPGDPNEDCIYEDLNANGRLDFADVVVYFNQMSWITANEPVEGFDLNYNGRIDFADIIVLFTRI
jgi:PKD repeat protein